MSGIAGIVHCDGKPVDRDLLSRMVSSLSFRGPNAQEIWASAGVGLGHATQLMPGDGARALQPQTLGTGTWITADLRLDAREELVAELQTRGRDARISFSDSQLLLHAYDVWGEGCLGHLLGDFSFGLWDGRKQQLFCACDHFGIRQFYYLKAHSYLVFSNTLNCIRLYPQVSDKLNDAAICDFLLFGLNYEESTTSFADIERLPRAHWLRWSANGLEIREYWRPPTDGEIRYPKHVDYVEHFDELMGKTVADRTRPDCVGILLSGGIDSSSVAAICRERQRSEGHPKAFHAFTEIDEHSDDADGPAAKVVADALHIPLHCTSISDARLFEDWGGDNLQWPEPVDDPFALTMLRQFREIAAHGATVLLSGEGCDNLMDCEPIRHLRRLWKEGKRARAALEASAHSIARFRAPDGLRGPFRRIQRVLSQRRPKPLFPKWLNSELVESLNLKARWSDPLPNLPQNVHPEHANGYASLFLPQWRYMFERQDAAYTQAAIDVCYPFLDLRLVNYLLAIPEMPFFFRKFLLREAMRGRLPEKIRRRPKVSVRQSPFITALKQTKQSEFTFAEPPDESCRYINWKDVEMPSGKESRERGEEGIRPWCLSFWLASQKGRKNLSFEHHLKDS